MKKYLFLSIFFLIVNCTNNNSVYWCGDHPCINKKEKEAYFKKTMIVEIKDINKKTFKEKSDIEKLLQQAQINEKRRIKDEKELAKQIKLQDKRRIKEEKRLAKQAKLEEKRLAKQAKLEEKRRIKEERDLSKEVKLEEKKFVKDKKKTFKKEIPKKQKKKKEKSIDSVASLGPVKININKFSELVEKITEQNSLRPYPDINDIPK